MMADEDASAMRLPRGLGLRRKPIVADVASPTGTPSKETMRMAVPERPSACSANRWYR